MPVKIGIRPVSTTANPALRGFGLAFALAALLATVRPSTAQAPPPPPQSRFVVVLDAAHGGDDTGARFKSMTEKDFTLALSVRLRSLLSARGIQVITTRESDAAIDLNRRAEIANHANAGACISLHASDSGAGPHLFVSSLAPTQPTVFAAWKTAQSAWVSRSLALAGVLNSALVQAGMTPTLGRTALPAVDSMTCPAVAIEIAPLRIAGHKTTATLDDPGYQANVAGALAAAILEWKAEARQP